MMIPRPTPPIPIPTGKKEIALLLASGVIIGGKYLWKKWKEHKNMSQQNTPGVFTPTIASEEDNSFGTMQSSSGEDISLKAVSFKGDIDGLLFSSIITQEYKNETDETLEIIYTFPIGYGTALLGMDATIGEKKLHGEVVAKQKAEEQYEEAIEKGDSAIMLQQSSMGLYTANLGNIKPGETVKVMIHCSKLLNYDQGRIRIAIPTVIGERYGNPYCPGGLAAHESAKVDKNASYAFNLSLTVHGNISQGMLDCPTHKVSYGQQEDGITINLDADAHLDRDFVLLINGLSGETSALCAPDEDKWMEVASFCPHMPNVEDNPLGLKILVDCSGSMSGMSIKQAQKGLQKILKLLKPNDYVSYSRFGSDYEHLSNQMLPCNDQNLQKLFAAIDSTEADMGGTEMEKAVLSTIKDIKQNGDVPPVLLAITDGDIWEVKSLIESAKKTGHRIFVIGVGAAPAESVLINLANETGGACEFVTENENMSEGIVRMFHRMRGKTAKNIQIDWTEKAVWQSALPKYIYDGETVHCFALFDRKPQSGATLSWQAGEEKYTSSISVISETDNTSLVRLGRKCQMEEAATEKEKIALGVKYQLVSDVTSLILVYERPEEEKAKGLPKIQQVPQMPAYGHGNYQALNEMGICNAFAMTSGGIWGGSFWHTRYDKSIPIINNQEYAELLSLWKNQVLVIASLLEFINLVKQEKKFASIVKMLECIKSAAGFPEENVWANFLAKILEEKKMLERHDKRLLNPYLYTDQDLQKFENAMLISA